MQQGHPPPTSLSLFLPIPLFAKTASIHPSPSPLSPLLARRHSTLVLEFAIATLMPFTPLHRLRPYLRRNVVASVISGRLDLYYHLSAFGLHSSLWVLGGISSKNLIPTAAVTPWLEDGRSEAEWSRRRRTGCGGGK
ncbi:hypothetical protein RIF29_07886 [Crotalaria pallida]|uniref:Uncharacterized protein n=1 Tax=Crotalaria pallida TaxID=3830 RepID=A0AAN9J682_CROPI